jgi:hypothetical protein
MTVYVVLMRMFGDPECHAYPLGVYDTAEQAAKDGIFESECRGGQYEYSVYTFDLNAGRPLPHIKATV